MKKIVLYLCFAAFLFATMEVGMKLAGSSIDAFQITYIRFLIAGIMLLPLAYKESIGKTRYIKINHVISFAVLGGLYIPVSMICFQLGVINSNASTAAVMISFTPVFVIIVNALLGFSRLSFHAIVVILLGLIGMAFIISPWDIQPGNSTLGMVLLVIAPFAFALYTVFGKKVGDEIGIMTMTSISFILGAFVILILTIVTGRPVLAGLLDQWLIVLYVGICATGLGYLFYFLVIDYSDAATGSIVFYIKPAIAPLIAMIVLGESIYWNTIVGIIALLLASWINTYKPKVGGNLLQKNTD